MSVLKEFKEFALKGSVVDLAVGIIIGGAFGGLVKSIVEDLLMPVLGSVVGKISFNSLYLNLSGQQFATVDEARKSGAPNIYYGSFLQNVISFLIIAACVFAIVKIMNAAVRKKPATPAATPEDILILRDIRDALKTERRPLA